MTDQQPKKHLTLQQRMWMVAFLFARSENGKLTFGAVKEASAHFGCHRNTVTNIWKRRTKTMTLVNPMGDLASRIKGNSGRKPIDDEETLECLKRVKLCQRSTFRGAAAASKVSVKVIQRLVRSGRFSRRTSTLKPALTQQNKIGRLHYCLSKVDPVTKRFDPMYNTVMIDKKIFNQDKDKYSLPC